MPDDAAAREIDATPLAVRALLGELFARPDLASLPPSVRDAAELVLAEVLNNIVEHAYDGANGRIGVWAQRAGHRVTCRVTDHGRPMPNGQAPKGDLPTHQLAEGGWGWHLIRSLSQDLCYCRTAGQNILTFSILETDPVGAG